MNNLIKEGKNGNTYKCKICGNEFFIKKNKICNCGECNYDLCSQCDDYK